MIKILLFIPFMFCIQCYGQKSNPLEGKVLEFHSQHSFKTKKDYKSAILHYKSKDSIWDFRGFDEKVVFYKDSDVIMKGPKKTTRKVSSTYLAKYKFIRLNDTIYFYWRCKQYPKISSYLTNSFDTLEHHVPMILQLTQCNRTFAYSTFLVKKDTLVNLAGINFHCYLFKQFLDYFGEQSSGKYQRYGWELVFIDKQTLLPLQILTLSDDGMEPNGSEFYLYSIRPAI